ncbi:MAG: glycoside hydrolase family 9 protein, partial [Deltaproteobacteria bacterium]|nr:glycoside hydrolase family 9 protein [Deltaproteobacteria bacterium]
MLVALTLLLTALPAAAPAAVALRHRVTGAWSTGFQGEIAVDNTGPGAIDGWRLSFDLPAAIVDLWGATVVAHAGDRYDLAPAAWSATIPAGGSITIGFVAQRDGGAVDPSGCVFDGAACTFAAGGGVTPSPAPSGGATAAPTRTATPDAGGVYLGSGPSLAPIYNYGRALQQAWYFYEAQRSGPLPRFDGDLPFFDPATGARLHDGFLANRLPWRGDSDVGDGGDVGLDLTGGWHDAGDHVKFGLPMAFSASFLAWGVLEYEDTLRATGQLGYARDNLRWVADWFVRAHPEPNVLWGQVGQGDIDHRIWGPPEVMPHVRPAWRIDLAHPGPDLAAQTSSALAIISMVFRADEPAYAAVLLRHAVELYDFAQATRAPETPTDKSLGRYSDSILDARSYYASTSGAQDDLPWAAAWLYRATGEARYLHDAEA